MKKDVLAIERYDSSGKLVRSWGRRRGTVLTDLPDSQLERIRGIAIDSLGRVTTGGWAWFPNWKHQFVLARYFSNGRLDPTIRNGGARHHDVKSGTADSLNALVLDKQQRIVTTGSVDIGNGRQRMVLAAFDGKYGEPIQSFRNGGEDHHQFVQGDRSSVGTSIAIDSKGRIIVAGATSGPNDGQMAVARFLPSGALDTTFGSGGNLPVRFPDTWGPFRDDVAVVVDNRDHIILASSLGGRNTNWLHRVFVTQIDPSGFRNAAYQFPNGTIDMRFLRDMALDRNGNLYIVGANEFSPHNMRAVAICATRTGALKSNWADKGVYKSRRQQSSFSGIAIDRQGRAVAAGGVSGKFFVMRFDKKGDPDKSFNGSGTLVRDLIHSDFESFADVAIDPKTGDIIAAGHARKFKDLRVKVKLDSVHYQSGDVGNDWTFRVSTGAIGHGGKEVTFRTKLDAGKKFVPSNKTIYEETLGSELSGYTISTSVFAIERDEAWFGDDLGLAIGVPAFVKRDDATKKNVQKLRIPIRVFDVWWSATLVFNISVEATLV